MCATCGCGGNADDNAVITIAGEDNHHHVHDSDHVHDDDHPHTHTVLLEQRVLEKNETLAAENRQWLVQRRILALNLTSSPGAGKTTLLERSIRELGQTRTVSVIEGDQETLLDADRIRAAGARAVQINTGAGCHLDAAMVHRALDALDPPPASLLFIENVGNLVCPALFDLGEYSKVVVISVTEGADKPLKYPHMFAAADLVIVNKVDLLPYVDFDVAVFSQHAQAVNPGVEILPVSATRGDGIDAWHQWIGDCANTLMSQRSLTSQTHRSKPKR